VEETLDGAELKSFPHVHHDSDRRVIQMDKSKGANGFPEHPGEVLEGWTFNI